MTWLVDGLAKLSSLRDREALDFALVALVRECGKGQFAAVRLLRLVGEPADLRWQQAANLLADQDSPDRDRGWVDLAALPGMQEFPERRQCLELGDTLHSTSVPGRVLFPIGAEGKMEGLLEIDSDTGLLPNRASLALVRGVLSIYRNLEGLLDYGEKDSLTELLNRKTFDSAFLKASLFQLHQQDGMQPDRRVHHSGQYWLAVTDIDHFKRVNDNYGHLIGDEVLLLTARLMRASFRLNDQLYRFGGEEFVILMRCTSEADAHSALERFRQRVEEHDFPQVGHITVSVGFAPLKADDTPGAGFDRADKSVYYAKTHGRNQVSSYARLVEEGELVETPELSQEADFF